MTMLRNPPSRAAVSNLDPPTRCLMPRHLRSLFSFTMLFSALACAGQQPSLIERSPFLPPDFQPPTTARRAPAAKQSPASLERFIQFRGTYELDGQRFFNIYDSRAKLGKWVAFNDASATYHVTHYDPANQSVEVAVEGQSLQLAMAKMSEPSGQAAAPPRVVQPPTARPRETVRPATPENSGRRPMRRRVIRPSNQ